VYALEAEVAPGNSGGPLLTGSGAVAGVVFARDEAHEDVGYAMTNAELLPVLTSVDGTGGPAPTGRCTP
jgi:S1-C subfamily serine protease